MRYLTPPAKKGAQSTTILRKSFGKTIIPVKLNLTQKEQLGEFLGFFAGDGSFYHSPKGHYRITFFLSEKEPLIIERIVFLSKQLFEKGPYLWHRKTSHMYIARLFSKDVYLLLKEFLYWEKDKTNTIRLQPNHIHDKKLMKGFIRGLINTEGYVYVKKYRVSFGSVSKSLISQCAEILKSLGVEFITYTVKPRMNHKAFHTIEIEGKRKLRVFEDKVSLINSDKGIKIKQILSGHSLAW